MLRWSMLSTIFRSTVGWRLEAVDLCQHDGGGPIVAVSGYLKGSVWQDEAQLIEWMDATGWRGSEAEAIALARRG